MRPVRTTVQVDGTTGEVTGISTVYTSPPQGEPPYVKMYIDGIEKLRAIPLSCFPVVIWLLRMIPYANVDKGFEFGPAMRKRAAKEIGISHGRINHIISDLLNAGVLLKLDRGFYQFDPLIFARGEWKDIQKLRSCGG